MKWFYMSLPLGFVVGFWAILGPLAIKKAWRDADFLSLDSMKCKLSTILIFTFFLTLAMLDIPRIS